jgi:Fic-DOC domain mobile mystery protein B
MSDLFEEPHDATPLTAEEKRELIPAHITYRRELNEAEQENIARAQDWALNRRRDPVSEESVKELHRRMLGEVWRWAGKFRASEQNLGIPFYEIPVALRQLLDDAREWIEYRTYPRDEIAVRCWHSRGHSSFRGDAEFLYHGLDFWVVPQNNNRSAFAG